ncbi:uncharacterized protein At4g22758-like [Macadamia integrifolia]|uniref:uncharacterized protein At4g22758-like n=1 Tax=Macadamia integrifolia TaxID=60698 RepID=UPI001C4EFE85|nr:uncharacterized protein At4g22758-like [Macadamia integrifolia]
MPNPSKSGHRKGLEDNGKGARKLKNKAASFHGRPHPIGAGIRRPNTDPDLLSAGKFQEIPSEMPVRLTKLLLNVTILRSLGAIQVVMSPESTVGDLIAAAVKLYAKEGRRPLLPTTDPAGFDLHYSQFSLESLIREEKLKELGSRNFFLCPKNPDRAAVEASSSSSTLSSSAAVASSSSSSSSSCSNQAEKVSKFAFPWLRFMDFSL